MRRAFLIVLDSVGVGGAPDAGAYGDAGADTIGHIAKACAEGWADAKDLREGPLSVPHLVALGLGEAAELASGVYPDGTTRLPRVAAQWGCANSLSKGKDTPSGHWELSGTPVPFTLGYFPDRVPAFPSQLMIGLIAEAQLPGILGDRHASGTFIVGELGAEHVRTLKPICYTSTDSVLQIAAHEEAFGLERLYEVCAVARRLVDPLKVGRVIARPFVGSEAAGFTRTANRKDYSIPPPLGNLLDRAAVAERSVITLGKIGDIFAHRATGEEVKAPDNAAMFDALLGAMERLPDEGLLFANFVDFDSLFGHRRDVAGYAAALESFDRRIPELVARLRPGDLVVFTADHGNDPTFRGSEHTRERVPILAFGPGIAPGPIGVRETLADVGETVAVHLGFSTNGPGKAWGIAEHPAAGAEEPAGA